MTALSLELNFICCNTCYFIYFASTFNFYSNGIFKYLLDKVKPAFTNEGYPYVFSNEWHRMNFWLYNWDTLDYWRLTRIIRSKVWKRSFYSPHQHPKVIYSPSNLNVWNESSKMTPLSLESGAKNFISWFK